LEAAVPSDTYKQLIARVRDLHLANSVEQLLDWDQETYMPSRAAPTRAAQMALIAGIGQEKLLDPEFGRLLEAAEAEADDDVIVATNVRETRRIYNRRVKLPAVLVRQIAGTIALAKDAWAGARRESRFDDFAPHLEKLLDLKREVAERVGYEADPYDALLDEFEPGARAADVDALFAEIKAVLVPLVRDIKASKTQPDTAVRERECPVPRQVTFGRRVAEAMGFDFEAGRLDTSVHPFCSSCSPLDVRMTSRYDAHYLPMSLFGIMHEAGHGLYEQGLPAEHAHTPAGMFVSLGIHESQSRLWENLVGRSRPFWASCFAQLQAEFPALADVTVDDWYFAINAVQPSFIRVEADEVTYNLHIMLRFALERQMIAGKLKVKDVPEAWNDGMQELLGITPPDDAQGCLQDIHWSMGIFGYFPTYTLGNLYAAQFFDAAGRDLPELDMHLARGNLKPLRNWLRESIHQHGQRYRAGELVKEVTGAPLSTAAFARYLQRKFKPLYGV
jgi:carboxypeptidase Taq